MLRKRARLAWKRAGSHAVPGVVGCAWPLAMHGHADVEPTRRTGAGSNGCVAGLIWLAGLVG